MRTLIATKAQKQRGASVALLALLLPVLIGFVAVSVDVAVITTARAQLKTAADAAAMAGAYHLADNYRVQGGTVLTTEFNNAQSHAKITAQANKVLGQPAVIVDNPSNSPGGDVVIGAWNPFTHTWSPPPLANIQQTNSVMVTARRSSDHTGAVPNYFGSALGFNGTTLNVSSIATVQNYQISGFRSVNNLSADLLPIALDVTTYNKMLTRDPTVVTDQYTFTPSSYSPPTSNGVTSGPDGIYESVLYPVTSGNPGNWGTVKIGVSNNSTSTLAAQIQYGITPAQLSNYPNGTVQLDTTQVPPQITLGGNPGISAGIKGAVSAIIGKAVTIPIYDQSGGNGNNAWYRVIAFQGVRIMASNFQGNPKYVIVQPALVQDPTAIPGPPQPAWTSGGMIRVNLTQ
jgi:hypothetical protein